MTDTATIPAPDHAYTPETDWQPYSDKRTYYRRWNSTLDYERYGEADGVKALVVEVEHNKHRKAYVVEAYVVGYRDGITSRSFSLCLGGGESPVIHSEPAPRFNRKRLDALAVEWETKFTEHLTGEAAEVWESLTAAAE